MNWDDNNLTHSLHIMKKIEAEESKERLQSFSADRALIVMGKNENFARALWEVGYQLLNLLLQARSVDIPYRSFLLNETKKQNLAKIGIIDPVAVLAL